MQVILSALLKLLTPLLLVSSLYFGWESYSLNKELSAFKEQQTQVVQDYIDKINSIGKEKNEIISQYIKENQELATTNANLNNDVGRLQYKLDEAIRLSTGGTCDTSSTDGKALSQCYRNLKQGTALLQECGKLLRENALKHDKLVELIEVYNGKQIRSTPDRQETTGKN